MPDEPRMLADQPLISCLVPMFNAETYIAEALDSILAQTYGKTEIVVVDDGSTDRSADVVRGHGAGVHLVSQSNTGLGGARNACLRHARGPFIAYLDADDVWHPQKLELQMALFEAQPDTDICFGYAQNFWVDELDAERRKYRDWVLAAPVRSLILSTSLLRRVVFKSCGPFDTALKELADKHWVMCIDEAGLTTRCIPDIILYRRLHRQNLTRRMDDDDRTNMVNLLKATLDRRRRAGMYKRTGSPDDRVRRVRRGAVPQP
jgi:glycosyltransferase involved in cell wall biosynthesis